MSRLAALRLAVAATIVTVSLAGVMLASQQSAAAMAGAATTFLDSLSADQRAKAVLPFESEDRLRWHYVPNETFPRQGLMIKDMNESQRRLAHDLLRTGLSAHGYNKVTAIIELEDVLKAIEKGGRIDRNKEAYLFTVFGAPGAKGLWGWRVEGHHVSLRFTIADGAVKGRIASTPMFLGANPAEVRDGDKKGLRILAQEEDAARALMAAFTPEQLKQVVVNTAAPNDILTTTTNDLSPLPDQGVTYASLRPEQQQLLVRLIEVYASNMTADLAADRMARIRAAGLDNVRFAWAGELERGRRHYYMIQGPTFLVEYDNTQNNANHIHSVWRDFNGDFGRDLLREHLRDWAH